MGTGIAIVYANAGIPVILKDADAHRLEKGWATIRAQYEADVEKGRLTTAAFGERMSRIRTSLEYDGFENVDIVVEAVNEDLDLKRRIFGELSAIVRPDAILATNTSSLNIDDIASTARDASELSDIAFLARRTDASLRDRSRSGHGPGSARQLDGGGKTLGKVGVFVGNCRGFVGNRMFDRYIRESMLLLEEGAGVEQIDSTLRNFGMAMGPFEVVDMAGLDIWAAARHQDEPASGRRISIADELYKRKRWGARQVAVFIAMKEKAVLQPATRKWKNSWKP